MQENRKRRRTRDRKENRAKDNTKKQHNKKIRQKKGQNCAPKSDKISEKRIEQENRTSTQT